jgi:hypothetical protein
MISATSSSSGFEDVDPVGAPAPPPPAIPIRKTRPQTAATTRPINSINQKSDTRPVSAAVSIKSTKLTLNEPSLEDQCRIDRLKKSAAIRAYTTVTPVASKTLQKRIDDISRNHHLRRVKEAKPRIDTSPPIKFVISKAKQEKLRKGELSIFISYRYASKSNI